MASKTRKAATVADIVAAAALGTLDPSTPMVTAEAAEAMARKAAEAAAANAAPVIGPAAETPALPADHHECGIPGCRHGAAHGATSQPDRQVKLQCPACGAVARMTAGAIARAARSSGGDGLPVCADGAKFAEAARRTYTRRSA